ncbi:hypothetical protein VKT23_008246 [Stygiomarasmius scandens]|uniref:F-box domain-containing protein n=1 Tax=Marasmiellus scandens TaxID=2682957 RepID=A0ABR1JJX0_9AGAR
MHISSSCKVDVRNSSPSTPEVVEMDHFTLECLPDELLLLIFKHGSQYSVIQPRHPNAPIKGLEFPSFLGTVLHVCHRWRKLILHTTFFWNSVHVIRSLILPVNDPWHPASVYLVNKHFLDLISESSSLRGGSPLDIIIDNTRFDVIYYPLPPPAIYLPAAFRSEQFRSLTILLSSFQNVYALMEEFDMLRELRRLESFDIICATTPGYHNPDAESFLPTFPSFLRKAQRLTTVRLTNVYLPWSNRLQEPSSLVLPWKCFELRWVPQLGFSFCKIQALLHRLPRLESLTLHFSFIHILPNCPIHPSDPPASTSARKITFPCLRNLDLRFASGCPRDTVSFIELFTVPNLESLTLRDMDSDGWSLARSSFASRSEADYPRLKHLSFYGSREFVVDDPKGMAEAFPLLTSLSLSDMRSNSFCQLLVKNSEDFRSGSASILWQDLVDLYIEHDPELDPDLVVAAAKARIDIGRPLKRVCLGDGIGLTESEMRQMAKALIMLGVNVSNA